MTALRFCSHGLLIVLIAGLTMGCANQGTVRGGQALAVKEAPAGWGSDENDGQPPVRGGNLIGEMPLNDPRGPFVQYNLCERIFFDYDQSSIKADSTECLDNIANALIQETAYTLIIEGHCDERGSDTYNIALGDRRAAATREYLVQRGLSANRIQIRSMGEAMPLAPCNNETCWSQNRRAEFYVVNIGR